jgi:hypothetical protein
MAGGCSYLRRIHTPFFRQITIMTENYGPAIDGYVSAFGVSFVAAIILV